MSVAVKYRRGPNPAPVAPPRTMTTRERLARAWYALRPAEVDGREVPFDDAPPVRLAWCWNRADDALAALAVGRAEAA